MNFFIPFSLYKQLIIYSGLNFKNKSNNVKNSINRQNCR